MDFWCFGCKAKKKVEPEAVEKKQTKTRVVHIMKGSCPDCGTKMAKIIDKRTYDKLKGKTKSDKNKNKNKSKKEEAEVQKKKVLPESSTLMSYRSGKPLHKERENRSDTLRFHGGHVRDIVVVIGSVVVAVTITPYGLLGFLALIVGMPQVDELIGTFKNILRRKSKIKEADEYRQEIERWVEKKKYELDQRYQEIERKEEDIREREENLKDIKEKIGVDRVRKNQEELLHSTRAQNREMLERIDKLIDTFMDRVDGDTKKLIKNNVYRE